MNQVNLIGNVVRDLELKTYNNGEGERKYLRFTLAINEYNFKIKDNIAAFIDVVAFDRKAEILSKYITKGRKLAVEGKIRPGSYLNNQGKKKYTVDVILNDFSFVDSPRTVANDEISEALPF